MKAFRTLLGAVACIAALILVAVLLCLFWIGVSVGAILAAMGSRKVMGLMP